MTILRYICTICTRVFCRRALLRRHHAVHSGYKEFTCSLCDYATSHKSNLERHMKIHETGNKFSSSSSSLSTAEESGQHDCSSPEDFFHPQDLSQSCCAPLQSRDNNPILASLLSQPAQDGEVMQWIYHSPYDSYSSKVLNQPTSNTVSDVPTTQHISRKEQCWPFGSLNEESFQEQSQEASEMVRRESPPKNSREVSSLPLRHAIDVILGVKGEQPDKTFFASFLYSGGNSSPSPASCVVTTASNHWSVGQLSSPTFPQIEAIPSFSNSDVTNHSSPESNSGMDLIFDHHTLCPGHKRPWQLTSIYHFSQASENRTSEVETEHDSTYVPKKLRMSKRYQSNQNV